MKTSKRELKEDIGFLYLAVDGVSRKEWEETVLKFVCKNISQELKRKRLRMAKALRKEFNRWFNDNESGELVEDMFPRILNDYLKGAK